MHLLLKHRKKPVMMQKKQPLDASIVREFNALNGVGHLVACVVDAADNGDTSQPLSKPITDV